MTLSTFPNGISSMGIPVLGNGIPMTYGRVIFVDAENGNDGNDGSSKEYAVKTIAQAYSLTTTNKDDVIVLSTNGVHTLTAMLNITKNRVHFIGDMFGRRYGQRARIYMATTTAVTDIHMVKNVGVGNTFTGIKFWNANALTQNTSGVGEGGEYAVYTNCEFYDSTKLDSNTHAELLLNGDSTQFYNCTFGSNADFVTGDKIRPAVITTQGGVSGGSALCYDILFDNCKFWKNAGGTTTSFVKVADADMARVMEFKNCQFMNCKLGGAVPAVAIDSATLTGGQIVLTGDTVAVNCTKVGTATGIINCTPARVATATIGIQAT